MGGLRCGPRVYGKIADASLPPSNRARPARRQNGPEERCSGPWMALPGVSARVLRVTVPLASTGLLGAIASISTIACSPMHSEIVFGFFSSRYEWGESAAGIV